MAGISVVDRSSLASTSRLGAEFYHPAKLSSLSKLAGIRSCLVRDCFSVIKASVAPRSEIVNDAFIFDLTDAADGLMREGTNLNNFAELGSAKKLFKRGDVLISRLRPYLREICLVSSKAKILLGSTEFIVLRQKSDILPEYLLAFLLTNEVQNILLWSQEGTNHPRFPETVLIDLPIPIMEQRQQHEIADMIRTAVEKIDNSRVLYAQAQQAVLEVTGFSNFDLEQSPFYAVTLSEANAVGRMDAEHFQPKYKLLLDHLRKTAGAKTLGELVTEPIRRGVQPEYVENGKVLALNSRYVGLQFIDIVNAERANEGFWQLNERARARRLDVVMNSTGWGTIGRANCVLHDEETVVDNHVSIIRPDGAVCDPRYLAVYLSSALGLMQTNKWLTGSSGQVELYPAAISRFVIALPDRKFQAQVADMVMWAYAARQKAKTLIEEAKQLVEDFIAGAG